MKLSIAFSKKTNLVKTVIRLIFSRKFNISLNIYLKLTKLNKVLTIPEYSKMVICKNAIAASWDTKCKRSCLSLVINDDGYLYISKDNH